MRATSEPFPYSGLSDEEAVSRTRRFGYNELPSARDGGLRGTVMHVLREPLFALLIAAGLVYLAIGDAGEALMLLGFVLLVIGITIHQERKSSRALEALRELSGPLAKVVRSGRQLRLPGREIVPGDTILISEGDRVPADGELLNSANLYVDESMLTGESTPIHKKVGETIFSGTLVIRGRGVGEITRTGAETEIGRIGASISEVAPGRTGLQRETQRIIARLGAVGVLLSASVVIIYGITRGDWLRAVLAGIALVMALLPEEFGVVMTVFMALGAWRMARMKVLTRNPSAIENLGAATVLCVDKTGTLTMNRITVKILFENGQTYDLEDHVDRPLPETLHPLLEYAVLASERDPFDPMETAIKATGARLLGGTEHLHEKWSIIQEYPLSERLLAMSNVWRSCTGGEYVVAAKGAPEAIMDLCHLRDSQKALFIDRVGRMGKNGLRVIGVARAFFNESEAFPRVQHDFRFEFLGLIGLEDPIRPSAPAAIDECRSAGIRVVMITGDYPDTAMSVARKIGLPRPDAVVRGDELEKASESELPGIVKTADIFARMNPASKLRLVQALKRNGEVVVMTGDGVNDAPALKAADIGIAMGGRGTDVAREAADLVLLDDDFSSIVAAVKLGRRIFDNIKKAMAYIIAVHIPIAGLSLLPVLLLWPLILMPVHIVFLQLIIDPVSSIVFEGEAEEEGVMRRPPRLPSERLLDRKTALFAAIQGASVFLAGTLAFRLGETSSADPGVGRGLAFTLVIAANIATILTSRAWLGGARSAFDLKNKGLWGICLLAAVFLAGILGLPVLRRLFGISLLSWKEVLAAVGIGVVSAGWILIFIFPRRHDRSRVARRDGEIPKESQTFI